MGYAPNIRAAQRLHSQVYLPLRDEFPSLRLKIIGRAPSPEIRALVGPGVEVTGEVESIWPHLAEVDVMVFPMDMGGGMQNKILESVAGGCPVVTTSICSSGYGVEGAHALWVAESDGEIREVTASLLRDGSLREETRSKGKGLVAALSWETILPRYESVLLGP